MDIDNSDDDKQDTTPDRIVFSEIIDFTTTPSDDAESIAAASHSVDAATGNAVKSTETPVTTVKDVLFHDVGDVILGRGLGVVLKLLNNRGLLDKRNSISSNVLNRANVGNYAITQPKKEIRIQHIDEYGREMNPKQAFKAMGQAFHNKGPGIKKRVKRQKQYEREIKAKTVAASNTSNSIISTYKLQSTSKLSGNPYIVLDDILSQPKPNTEKNPSKDFSEK